MNFVDPSGEIFDTILDVGFIAFDVGKLGFDEVFRGGANRQENLTAPGADVAATFVPGVTGAGVATRFADDVARQGSKRLSRPLRNKTKRIDNEIAAGGFRGIAGSVSPDDALKLGKNFVGDKFTTSVGKHGEDIFISADSLRQFRGPAPKGGINQLTGEPFSKTGVQVNFESRLTPKGPFPNNVHLDILRNGKR